MTIIRLIGSSLQIQRVFLIFLYNKQKENINQMIILNVILISLWLFIVIKLTTINNYNLFICFLQLKIIFIIFLCVPT